MKNIYTNPIADIINFRPCDLITASGNSSEDGITVTATYKGVGMGGGISDSVEY